MNKRFLLVAALCAAMNVASFAQTNLALNKEAYASTETTSEPAKNAFDGDLDTRWQVDAGNTDKEKVDQANDYAVTNGHWLYVDLGEEQDFNSIRIRWEGAYAKAFEIYTATEIDETTQEPKWGEAIYTKEEQLNDFSKYYLYDIGSQKARYVKLQATKLGYAGNWFSIYEMGIYNITDADKTPVLTTMTTSTDILKVGETFTVSFRDQFDQPMTDAEVTVSSNAEKLSDGSYKAIAEGDIVITAKANGKELTKTIQAYAPKLTTVSVSPAFVVTGNETALTFNVKDQRGNDIDGWTANIENNTIKAEADGTQTITISYGGESKDVTIYALSNAADVPTLNDTEDKALFFDSEEGLGYYEKVWEGGYASNDLIDFNGNKAMRVSNVATFGFKKSNLTETGYNTLNFDIYSDKTVEDAYIQYENAGLGNLNFKLEAGKWNHISLDVTGATAFNGYIKFKLGKEGATDNPNILVDNVYLHKAAEGSIVVAPNVNADGFITVNGNITSDNVDELKDYDGVAFDLTKANIDESITKIEFKNPNAIIYVAGDKTSYPIATQLVNTNNVIVKNEAWYFATKKMKFDDAYPINTNFSIDTDDFEEKGWEYTREIKANAWVTTYLPVGTTLPAGVKAYSLDTDSEGKTINLKEADNLAGETPYILHNTSNESATLTCGSETGDFNLTPSTKTVTAKNVIFHGNYKEVNGTGVEYALQNASADDNNTLTLRKVGEGATIGTFRAYFTLANDQDAKEISFKFEDELTAIKDINVEDAAKVNNIYSIDGKLVKANATSTNGLAKGVYIINGKKYIVK